MRQLFVVLLVLLHGCASAPQSRQIHAQGLGSLPASVELTRTPFFPQTLYQCGPAALATVLQSHGVATSPAELTSQVYLPDRKGSLQIEITAAARRHGMLPYPIRPQLTALFTEVAAGNPILVLQNRAFDWYTQWHYAVVIGYDTDTNEIILRSGTTKRWVSPMDVFERTWQRANYWALAIVPLGEIPRTAELLPYLKTAHAFEESEHPQHALKAYSAASAHWPDIATPWMTLGNLNYAMHDWLEAVNAFYMACQVDPASINSWNNLAYALQAYGCGPQAQAALQCGLNIRPTAKNLLDSLVELSNQPTDSRRDDCPLIQCN